MKTTITLLIALLALAVHAQTTNILYPTSYSVGSQTCPCGGNRMAYVVYSKTNGTFGWTSSSNTARVFVTPTNHVCVEAANDYGASTDKWDSVTFNPQKPIAGRPWKFALYFTNSLPTNVLSHYPINIVNFNVP